MIRYFFYGLIIMGCSSCSDDENRRSGNNLADSTSPYLLQHARNPVHWQPWGKEALSKAKKEDKMLLVSIGYAACHWCHVMEKESFEDSLVADLMNQHFVAIKVDKEERPDIDKVYMTACQLSGARSCGWPLNAFALPDGKPFWAGTYYPKEEWIDILNQFIQSYKANKGDLERFANNITRGIENVGIISRETSENILHASVLDSLAARVLEGIDYENGGRIGSPKFPMPDNFSFLLEFQHYKSNPKARTAVTKTLDLMMKGGIYDHLEGGFSRYSIDEYWQVPHFEKMLYDNAQLIGLYSDAYRVTKTQEYLTLVNETFNFLLHNFLDSGGGFYASYNADSEGEEGTYYIWEYESLKKILQEDLSVFEKFYEISEKGNWNGKNVLYLNRKVDLNTTEEELKILNQAKVKLLKSRSKRVKPTLDYKIITAWNGLMLSGLVKAYLATGNEKMLEIAVKLGKYLKREMLDSKSKLTRINTRGTKSIDGFLDDYAYVIAGFIALYETTFDMEWLGLSINMVEYLDDYFFNQTSGMYRYKSRKDQALVAITNDYSDNVIPSANSVMAQNLFLLGRMMSRNDLIKRSYQMLINIFPTIINTNEPSFYANWLSAYLSHLQDSYEVVIMGDKSILYSHELQRHYSNNVVFMGGEKESLPLMKNKLDDMKTTIYVCQNKVCKLPVYNVSDALQQMNH